MVAEEGVPRDVVEREARRAQLAARALGVEAGRAVLGRDRVEQPELAALGYLRRGRGGGLYDAE